MRHQPDIERVDCDEDVIAAVGVATVLVDNIVLEVVGGLGDDVLADVVAGFVDVVGTVVVGELAEIVVVDDGCELVDIVVVAAPDHKSGSFEKLYFHFSTLNDHLMY